MLSAMPRRAFVLTLAGIFLWIVTNGPAVQSGSAQAAASAALGVSAANPHYLEYRGRPLLLISSAEHYGAVINLDFDYVPYLAGLERSGLNQTRLWTGFYLEDPKAFNITNNLLSFLPGLDVGTLAAQPEKQREWSRRRPHASIGL